MAKNNITKILIANRGEIALRVMRTVRALGLKTVAVYSEADSDAPHVHFADESVLIGASPVGESYLRPENILAAAEKVGADAVHPGYGFLSENAEFAEAVEAAGLIFIGPTPRAIRLMGDKAEAKKLMLAAHVPCVPGYQGDDQSDATLIAEGEKIGFPLMVKASAGGGGRGMRLVHNKKDLPTALETARSEAKNAFGSDRLILEKAIIEPRHVELQIFADMHGGVVHLGERDCSVQRRHQKVVEEAPCPVMTDDLRAAMGDAAIDAAKSIDYRGAGTVEFLLDGNGEFYFLEMNTRLQVEHPVTEEITGLDLVALQIKVAQGEPLGLTQDDVSLRGHAIEVRLYAEDPYADFLPATGHIALWQEAHGAGIRIDSGIKSEQDISPFYDPMVAKIIAYGEDRETARRRLIKALRNTVLFGVRNNRDFLIDCLSRDRFAQGAATTAFIAQEFGDEGLSAPVPTLQHLAALGVLHYRAARAKAHAASVYVAPTLLNFTSSRALTSHYRLAIGEAEIDISLSCKGGEVYQVICGEQSATVKLVQASGTWTVLDIDDKRVEAISHVKAAQIFATLNGQNWVSEDLLALAHLGEEGGDGGRVVAPMHGRVIELCVTKGDKVEKNMRLAVIEAMKMQHDILAAADGVVADIFVSTDQQIAADDLMMDIDTGDDEEA